MHAYTEGEGAETIILQRESDAGVSVEQKQGFQVYITPYEPEEPVSVITPQIINRDVPGTVVEDPQVAVLGDGTEALLFWGNADGIGKTREVWIIHDGYLYEITTYAHLDTWLAHLMTSWRF